MIHHYQQDSWQAASASPKISISVETSGYESFVWMAMSQSGYGDATRKMKTSAHQENGDRKRILVVEDNPLSLVLIKQLLMVHGYKILENSGRFEGDRDRPR